MAYITLDELKTALGVGDLYPDDVLDDVIQTAESVLEPFLVTQSAPVSGAYMSANTVTFVTTFPHTFANGQSVVVTGTDYDSTYTITGNTDYTFTAARTGADVVQHTYKPRGHVSLATAANYDNVVAVRTAALMIAVDVWNARTVPGGQAQGIDFTPGPYMMGRSILNRVIGLIGRYRDVNGMVG
jgi:hypothetical protein